MLLKSGVGKPKNLGNYMVGVQAFRSLLFIFHTVSYQSLSY